MKLFLLFSELCRVLGDWSIQSIEGKICPLYREAAKYMTCLSTGRKQLKPACNCCVTAEKGCIIYLSNGNVTACPKK
jgi:hypothetical protein